MPVQQYDIVLNYDTSKATASLGAFRAEALRQFAQLTDKTAKFQVLKDLDVDAQKSAQSLAALNVRANELKRILESTNKGDVGYKTLKTSLADVNKEITATERGLKAQVSSLAALEKELGVAAKDTIALSAAQAQLARTLENVQKASAVNSARGVLGVTGAAEAKAQIDKLTQAYNVLRASGTATTQELTIAKAALNAKILEVNQAFAGTRGLTVGVGSAMAALSAAAYGVGSGLKAASVAAIAYEQGVARVSSITTQNKAQLQAMGQEVLALSVKIGIELPTAFAALYNIISSGIPPDNALKVLEVSAQAAVAGVTDIDTAARLGVAVLNAYGLQVAQLGRVYDVLFQTVRDGVVTFPELANSLGEILPVANTSGIALEEVSAAMIVLTRNGLSAAESSTAIQRAIQALTAPTPEAIRSLTALGIKYNGLYGTLKQIADKNLSADLLRTIVPDVRGERGIAILTRQLDLYKTSVDSATNSMGAAKSAFDKLKDTPEQNIKKLVAAFDAAKTSIGEKFLPVVDESVKALTRLIDGSSTLMDRLRSVDALFRLGSYSGGVYAKGLADVNAVTARFGPALEAAGVAAKDANFNVGSLSTTFVQLQAATEQAAAVAVKAAGKYGEVFGPIATQVNTALALVNTQIVTTEGSLKFFAERLGSTAAASKGLFDQINAQTTQGLQAGIVEVETALARREISERDATARIAALRKAAADAQLESLKKYSAQAIEVFDKEAQARRALAVKNGADVVALDIETKNARLKLIEELQTKLSAYYLDIANQEKAQVGLVRDAEDAKRGLREATAARIRDIQRLGMSEERAQQDQLLEAYQLRKKGEAEAEKGNLDLAQSYFAKSIELATATARKGGEDQARAKKEATKLILEESKKSSDEQIKDSAAVAVKLREFSEQERVGRIARSQGLDELKAGQKALDDLYSKNAAAAKKSAESFGDIKQAAIDATTEFKKQLEAIRTEQSVTIPLRIKEDSAQIDADLATLQTQLEKRGALVPVKLAVDTALADLQKLKDDIEKSKPQVEIQADLTKLRTSTDAAIKALPSVNLEADPSKVNSVLDTVGKSIIDLGKKRIELQTNIDAVAKELGELNGVKLDKKQLTIEVNYVYPNGKPATGAAAGASGAAGFNSGGLVAASSARARGAVLQGFASGGFVGKVPGVGNKDTVFARLQSGGFILRKTPSEILASLSGGASSASNIFNRVRDGSSGRGIPGSGKFSGGVGASAGTSGSIDSLIEAVQSRGTFERGGMISSLMEGAIRAMRANVTAYRAGKPLGFVERDAEDVTERNARPKVRAVQQAYSAAAATRNESAAGSATSAAIELAKELIAPLGNIDFNLRGQKGSGNFLADGGSPVGKGIIPAMLTPGEISFGPADVKRIGLGRLQALNAANTREQVIANLRAFNAGGQVQSLGAAFSENVLPMLRRFNDGGSVTNANTVANNNTANNTFNFTVNAGSNIDERALAQRLYSEFAAIERRRR